MDEKKKSDCEQIHLNIIYYAQRANLSLKELANKAGISESTIHSIKKGAFNFATLISISEALGVDVIDLMSIPPDFSVSPGFGERLARYRDRRGMTQGELGHWAGVSRQTIAKWESDDGGPSRSQAEKLSDALAVRFDLLFGAQGKESQLEESLTKIGSELDSLKEELNNIKSLTNLTSFERNLIGYIRSLPETERLLKLYSLTSDQHYLDEYQKLIRNSPSSSVDTSPTSHSTTKNHR